MNKKILQLQRETQHWINTKKQQTTIWLHQYYWRIILTVFIGILLFNKDVKIQIGNDGFSIGAFAAAIVPNLPDTIIINTANALETKQEFKVHTATANATTFSQPWSDATANAPQTVLTKNQATSNDNLANTYDNLIYTNPKFATKHTSKVERKKREKQIQYIKRFAKVAQAEMEKFNIPASITLAQGLLESNVGESRLATQNNNHFGMKCFSKSCKKGHCSNFTDDSHKDFFRMYKSAWDSYRAHSKMLGGKRYRKLKNLGTKDYKGWAKGLKTAGYATDKRYAEKLINLIEELELWRFDR